MIPVVDRIADLDWIDPEAVLAVSEHIRARQADTFERRIARAVMRRALMDLAAGDDAALVWLLESEDDPAEFGFAAPALCAHLGIDVDALRARIRGGWRPRRCRVST